MTRSSLLIATAALGLALAACTPADTGEDAAPETAATQGEATMAPEPSVGAPPPEGGGIPGAAEGNPAAAPAVSTPPETEAEADQTPQ
jgi:hypothetical protein